MITEQTKENKIINKRNAVKEADCFDQGPALISSEAKVITFTDEADDQQQVVNTRHYTANFGSLHTDNKIRADKVQVEHTFFQHTDADEVTAYAREARDGTIYCGIKDTDSDLPLFANNEMTLYLNRDTALDLANAILDAVESDKGELIVFKEA